MGYHSTWFKPGRQTQWAITINCLHAFFLLVTRYRALPGDGIRFGYDQGVFGGLISNPDFLAVVEPPSEAFLGFIVCRHYVLVLMRCEVSSYNLGCLAGCLLNFFVGSGIGRRPTLWLAMLLISLGAVLQAAAFGLRIGALTSLKTPQMVVGRIVTGFGTISTLHESHLPSMKHR
ncbi:hypothetical protein E4T42_08411 [Aureobasidium subglaciale]|nr:hypothetical protein E4T42_08411 [Aureobasidium subglaciale]